MLVEDDKPPRSRLGRERPGLELALWLLIPVILLLASVLQLFEQFSTVGCEGICDLDLNFSARAAYPWEVAASLVAAIALAVVLRRRGKPAYLAPLVGVVLVFSSAVVTSLLFQAALSPMHDRNARIAQGLAPAAPPPPEPTGRWGADAEEEPHLEFSPEGKLSGYDGCNHLSGRWTQDPDGKISFSAFTASTNVCDGVDTWLSRARSAAINEDFLYINGAAGSPIGGLPHSP